MILCAYCQEVFDYCIYFFYEYVQHGDIRSQSMQYGMTFWRIEMVQLKYQCSNNEKWKMNTSKYQNTEHNKNKIVCKYVHTNTCTYLFLHSSC